jgi:hypothetical protein
MLLDQQIQQPGLEADNRPRKEQRHSQDDFDGRHALQTKLLQTPLTQSVPTRQLCPAEHFGQVPPPQSTSVSLPFFTPSLQVGAWQTPPLQTLLWQTPEQHGCPSPPHAVHVPLPLQTMLVPQAVPAAANITLQVLLVHAAAEHGPFPGHTLPHAPQLFGSVRGVSQPSAGLVLQSPKPWLQDCSLQVPLVQVAVALAKLHWRPHAPQLLTSAMRLTQVPLQTVWPDGHCVTHTPL